MQYIPIIVAFLILLPFYVSLLSAGVYAGKIMAIRMVFKNNNNREDV